MKFSKKRYTRTKVGLDALTSWLDEIFKAPKEMPKYEMSEETKKIMLKIAEGAEKDKE